MLILTRRVGESVMIGKDVTITIVGVKGNQTRLGIIAPEEIPVHRGEIYERIRREHKMDVSERSTPAAVTASLVTLLQHDFRP